MSFKVKIPPIKSQGIKTKLVPWISSVIPENFTGRWIEPFMGTGVVAFNLAHKRALLCDTNPHVINFYSSVANDTLTPEMAREYLRKEGDILHEKGEIHYYSIRDRFNENHSPLDFLFINRAGFNGMIRFNGKGGFNIPFCRNPKRFTQAYITKIVNQIIYLSKLFKSKEFDFQCQGFEETILSAREGDIIYCDPPYIDRHADYYNRWNEVDEINLFKLLSASPAKFILSTWHHNDFRKNKYIDMLWDGYSIMTRDHFYHVGGELKNRNPMTEAMVLNYAAKITHKTEHIADINQQPVLFT
ncbi:DNA adenine methylase [Ventosimonas gracilis]|uniref:Site-specific DNA-methyltransferase (adenine-specific) n=1 Tax=Ventosimonas gracilis TaxID=1680762 RepID=A0A139SQJ7_9GAMM|nr:Dam family site-specific DNA-(adenine-N6)-methyltransferase [Ventosimonas gracilis]KXU36784.1 DNA adenine methylase [Ventosimonas gracilis]